MAAEQERLGQQRLHLEAAQQELRSLVAELEQQLQVRPLGLRRTSSFIVQTSKRSFLHWHQSGPIRIEPNALTVKNAAKMCMFHKRFNIISSLDIILLKYTVKK